MIYTLDEIRSRVKPVAEKYNLRAVYLFGSYARNEATENSDIDLLVDRSGSKIQSMFDMGGLYEDLCRTMCKEVDLVTTQTLEQASTRARNPLFIKSIHEERIRLT